MLIRFLRQKVTDFKKNTQGIVVPIFAAVAFTVVTVVAVAVDVSKFNDIEKELQALADKSVQNALSRRNMAGQNKTFLTVCNENFKNGFNNNQLLKNNVTFYGGSIPAPCILEDVTIHKAIRLRLEVTANIKTPFSGITGGGYTTTIISVASLNDIKHEIVIVASIAGTMCGNFTKNADGTLKVEKVTQKFEIIRNALNFLDNIIDKIFSFKKKSGGATTAEANTTVTEECPKAASMKLGIHDLLWQIKYFQDLKIGFVPFNHKVKFPNPSKIPPSLLNSKLIEGRDETSILEDISIYTDHPIETLQDGYLPEILPLTSAQLGAEGGALSKVLNAIGSINVTDNSEAWARTDLGMHVAGLMLDPDSKEYFNNEPVEDFSVSTEESLSDYGGTGKGLKKDPVKKIIVLMTDGMNVGSVYTNHPTGNFENNYIYQYEPYNKHLQDVCNVLKRKGVQIFTIITQNDIVNSTDTLATDIENNIARCSSDTPAVKPEEVGYVFADNSDEQKKCKNNRYCYKVKSPEELSVVLSTIGKKLNKVIRQK